jgi:hypothetical protein
MMHATMEVRWFYSGALPPDVGGWFLQGEGQPVDPSLRVDHYLPVAKGDGLGIKLREGRLELKRRHRQLGVVRLHRRVAGIMEHWRKWSFPLADLNNGLTSVVHPASGWIGVYKRRRLQRYQVLDEGELLAVSSQHYPDQGCDLELTEVQAAGAAWWTLSFEAFGTEARLQKNLGLVADRILSTTDPPVLAVEYSHGYPRWLRIVEGVED